MCASFVCLISRIRTHDSVPIILADEWQVSVISSRLSPYALCYIGLRSTRPPQTFVYRLRRVVVCMVVRLESYLHETDIVEGVVHEDSSA
jgi:hypothetical protein